MDNKIFLSLIREKLTQNELNQVISQLKLLLDNSPKLNDLLIQSARYNDILLQIKQGVINYENTNISKNQVRLSLLELIDKIQLLEEKPIIKKEVEQAINVDNSKNLVIDSTITARDVHIGDKNIHSESKNSKRLRVFLFFFVPLLAISGAYFWYQYNKMKRPLVIKVLLENKTPNASLSKPTGSLILTYGGKQNSKTEVSNEALYENIPPNFKNESFRLQYDAIGFTPIDTTFKYKEVVNINISRNDDLGIINGYVFEEGTEPLSGIENVKVSINCCSTFTDGSGSFSLKIPFNYQRKKQRLEFFKEGFHQKSLTEPVIKETKIMTYLIKK